MIARRWVSSISSVVVTCGLSLLGAGCGGGHGGRARSGDGVHVAAPEDLLGTVAVRDPQATITRVSAALGVDPRKAWLRVPETSKDLAFRALFESADPHATWFLAATGELEDPRLKHACAVRLRDEDASKTWGDDGALRRGGTVLGKPAFRSARAGAVIAAVEGHGLIGDDESSLESLGEYVIARSEAAPSHDLELTIPLVRHREQLHAFASRTVRELLSSSSEVDEAVSPLVGRLLSAIDDIEGLDGAVDVSGDDLRFDAKLRVGGESGAWLGRYPVGSASSVLSLPRGELVLLLRYPDEIGAIVSRAFEDSTAKGSQNPRAVSFLVRSFAATLGHELAMVIPRFTKPAGQKTQDALMRAELVDAPRAGSLLRDALEKWVGQDPSRKLAAWQRAGASGHRMTYTNAAGDEVEMIVAIRAPYLYVEILPQPGGQARLLEAALDASPKSTFRGDPSATKALSAVPSSGLVMALYTASPALPSWGWVTAEKGALNVSTTLPKTVWGPIARVALEEGKPKGE
jgi:hypothetical protein